MDHLQGKTQAPLSSSTLAEEAAKSPPPDGAAPRAGKLALRVAWLVGWGTKGGLALTDQALSAGAQFALNILLARWLLPAEYGAFAIAYSVFLLAAGVHGALLVEPMIIFGSGRYFQSRKSYLGIVLRGHWVLTVPAGLALFGVAFLFRGLYVPTVERALCALGLVLPLALFPRLTRRAFYIDLRPGHAAVGGAAYFLSLLGFIWWLRVARMLTPASALVAMGGAALLTGGLQLAWLRPKLVSAPEGLVPARFVSEHWGYGRWVLASVFPSWVLLSIYYLALPTWFGLKAAGVLKALLNLAMPASHSLIAFGMLIAPLLVRHRDRGGMALMRQTVRRVSILFIVGAATYLVALWSFRVQLIHLLYGGKYLEYDGVPVLLAGLMPFATACVVPLGSALRACERPDNVFWGYLGGAIAAVSVGLLLAFTWGVVGALIGNLVSYGAVISVFWFFYRKAEPQGTPA